MRSDHLDTFSWISNRQCVNVILDNNSFTLLPSVIDDYFTPDDGDGADTHSILLRDPDPSPDLINLQLLGSDPGAGRTFLFIQTNWTLLTISGTTSRHLASSTCPPFSLPRSGITPSVSSLSPQATSGWPGRIATQL